MPDDARNLDRIYTAEEFLKITAADEKNRYELIDGQIYTMAAPTFNHQRIVSFTHKKISNYLEGKECEAFVAPLDVFLLDASEFMLFSDNEINISKYCRNVYQPDVMVVCDKRKFNKRGICGAPDLVVEVISPSTSSHDYIYKFHKYLHYGVKELWLVDPGTKEITVHNSTEKFEGYHNYTFDEIVKSEIFDGLSVNFSELELL